MFVQISRLFSEKRRRIDVSEGRNERTLSIKQVYFTAMSLAIRGLRSSTNQFTRNESAE